MEPSVKQGQTAAITGYILIIGVLIAMSMNSEHKNKFASFHIRQALGLSLTFILLGIVVSNFEDLSITFAMWLFMSVLWGFGLFTAIQGRIDPIPLLGPFYQKIFKTLG